MTAVAWAKVSADIFANRKIREAGLLGSHVYLFVLTQNASRGATGAIPADDLAVWFVADTLRMTEEQAKEGIERAIKARLIAVDADRVVICGWDDEWAKRPLTEAERKRKQRARAAQVTHPPTEDRTNPDACPDSVRTDVTPERDGPECPRGEERRGEERRERTA